MSCLPPFKRNQLHFWWDNLCEKTATLPETNKSPLKNGWLEYDSFLLGPGLSSGAKAVSFRKGNCTEDLGSLFPSSYHGCWWALHPRTMPNCTPDRRILPRFGPGTLPETLTNFCPQKIDGPYKVGPGSRYKWSYGAPISRVMTQL